MRIQTFKKDGPGKIVGEAIIVFDEDSILEGLKLSGFTIWNGDDGYFVTVPSQKNPTTEKYFEFLREAGAEKNGFKNLKRLKVDIVDAFLNKERAVSRTPVPDEPF